MPQTPIPNSQASLALTQYIPLEIGGSTGFLLGEIGTFAGGFVPSGTNASGQLLSTAAFGDAFSVMGNVFGGDGLADFALPDLDGVTMIGAGQGPGLDQETLGQQVGASTVTLNAAQTPPALGGTSEPFDNYQPSLPITYEILTEGSFPSESGGGDLDMVGRIVPFAGSSNADGLMPCDGRLLSISQYTALYDIIGNTYGGDGISTFALPDLRGRDIVGSSSSAPVGSVVGSADVRLSNAQAPDGLGDPVTPFDNREPSLSMEYLIATSGLFPAHDGSAGQDSTRPFLGQIVAFAGNIIPRGWALCNGSLLPIAQNIPLFSLLATTYGGDGRSTFALPDLRDKTVVGASSSQPVGTVFGADSVTITDDQLPDTTADKAPFATLAVDPLISAADVGATSFTVAGLDADASAIAIFTDGATIITANVAADGTYAVGLSTLAPGTITSSLVITDTTGNTATVAGNDSVLDTTSTLTLKLPQFLAWGPAQLADFTTITLIGGPAYLHKFLTPDLIATLGPAGVDFLQSSTGALALSVEQFDALGTVTLASDVTLRDAGATLAGLDIAALAGKGVVKLDATDDALALTVAQFRALGTVALTGGNDVVTLADTGAHLAALSAGEIGALAGKGVDRIDATDNALALGADQFNALGRVAVAADDVLTLTGTEANDSFSFRRQAFSLADHIDGGAGTDSLTLGGGFSGAFDAGTMAGIERLGFVAGHSYAVTLDDANVGAGQRLNVNGTGLGALDSLSFDGSAETDGSFRFTGGAGTNSFTGGDGADAIIAGSGHDTFRYTAAAQSTGTAYDTITGFDATADKFSLLASPGVTGVDPAVTTGGLSKGSFTADLTAAMSGLEANHAALFTPDAGGMSGTQFLIVDINGTAGYQAGADLVVRLVNPTHLDAFGTGNFT